MDIGVCIASHIQDVDYAVAAEAQGFSHAWFADSQMLWSDCYACLALAASRTQTIRLGTGVAISGTRPAPVNAASIATINALAPGRTFFGLGAGNTAMRVMGLPPQRLKDFEQYLTVVKPLLRGEEAMMPSPFGDRPIRHIMPEHGFVNFDAPIPLYVSGFGPKSLALAGRFGDGAVLSLPHSQAAMQGIWAALSADHGAELDRDRFYTTALTAIAILEPQEAVNSDRVINLCGAMAMASVHYAYDQARNFGHQPPNLFAEIWEDYCALLATYPEARRHQRIHLGHNCWVLPEELQFLTPAILQGTCLIGTQDQVLQRLFELEQAGLKQVMNLPNFDTRYTSMASLSEKIIPNMPRLD
ncbi:MAG: LLM class flavin-dependent oxidoreductase [Gammaproteobacteria bacterium]|jgi:5,10-methylenetetrahydromethanopterin reductase|nr:LLM class flavin-dependent oxidoreductase [Gammaproteobacteria bacterium]MDA8950742.1 LLM class flavin-dependent oxidoreductase [Pseudomonadales bacterium]MBT6791017.1 LLM class flavin-dependent oxidoreductase [Gammaproteobacteria bacterium]MBT7885061.1 LLM class flavin-dependent oxidoreductase [Gammaproteobacteria bacterium]MCH9821500.1 LLM class flavin-dependent oxidoreductase [Gammaproteobacteria bacterium]|tara:strand:+ start:865 stop:1938 length:1074 start_codon:yes stop_codon:yes gene_type:complete